MADRYWVGGSGTWNTTSTTNWSSTSGGAGGASVPTAADSVFFDQAGTYTVTMTGALTCLDFNVSAGSVTFATGTSPTLAISGNLNITGVTPTWNSTGTITFNSNTAKTIRSNNTIFGGNVTFDGVGGTWQLLDNLTVDTNAALRTTTLTNGTIDLNDFVLATPFFNSTNSNVRGINFRNSSKIQVTYNAGTAGQRQWDCTTATNLTLSYVNDPLVEFPNVGTTQAYCGVSHASGAGGSESVAISLLISNGSIPFTTNNGAEHFRNVTFSDSYSGTVLRLGSIYGNMVLSANATYSGITNINFAKSTGTQTFTTKNKVFTFPVFKLNAGTLQLIGDLDIGTQTFTLTSGTFDLNNYISKNSVFGLSGTGAKTIAFGTGKIQCTNTTATGAIFGGSSSQALLTCTGSKQVEFTGNGFNSFGYRQFACSGVTEANALNLKMTAGGGALNIFNNTNLNNIELAGGVSGSSIAFQPNCIVYGNITIEVVAASPSINASSSTSLTLGKTSGTQTIQMNGTVCDLSMTKTGAGILQLGDALTLTSSRTFTLTAGTLDLNNLSLTCGLLSSTNSNTRLIQFGTGKIVVTGNNSDPIWDTRTATNFSFTGSGRVEFNYAGSVGTRVIRHGTTSGTEANSPNFYITSGTDIFQIGPSGSQTRCGDVDFTGFSGTYVGAGGQNRTIYGNWTFSPEMNVSSAAQDLITFSSTSTKTIRSNGKTFTGTISFNGNEGTWSLLDNMTVPSAYICSLSNGTINLNGYTLNAGLSFTTGVGTKNITFNGGTLLCPASTTTAFNNAQPTGFTTTGIGIISMTGSTAKTFVGGGSTYTCAINQGGAGDLTITGTNSFDDITATFFPSSILLAANQTVSKITLQGTPTNKVTLKSSVDGTPRTLTDTSGLNVVKNCIIRDSAATGGANFRAPINFDNQDVSGNSGWDFSGWNPTGFMQFLLNSFRA